MRPGGARPTDPRNARPGDRLRREPDCGLIFLPALNLSAAVTTKLGVLRTGDGIHP
jgi:hypothetical protein